MCEWITIFTISIIIIFPLEIIQCVQFNCISFSHSFHQRNVIFQFFFLKPIKYSSNSHFSPSFAFFSLFPYFSIFLCTSSHSVSIRFASNDIVITFERLPLSLICGTRCNQHTKCSFNGNAVRIFNSILSIDGNGRENESERENQSLVSTNLRTKLKLQALCYLMSVWVSRLCRDIAILCLHFQFLKIWIIRRCICKYLLLRNYSCWSECWKFCMWLVISFLKVFRFGFSHSCVSCKLRGLRSCVCLWQRMSPFAYLNLVIPSYTGSNSKNTRVIWISRV